MTEKLNMHIIVVVPVDMSLIQMFERLHYALECDGSVGKQSCNAEMNEFQ